MFADVTQKWVPSLGKVVEHINGKAGAPEYLYKTMLRPEFSVDQKWSTASVDTTFVAADFVDPNSPLPLKKRDAIESHSGSLPTLGMKLTMNRAEINAVQMMQARGVASEELVRKVMNDALRCVTGIQEQLEWSFLEGLSNGYTGVVGADGKMARIDYGYKARNMYSSIANWFEDGGATPVSDIARVLEKAQGTTKIMIGRRAFNTLRRSAEGRFLAAASNGVPIVSTSRESIRNLPIATPARFAEAFRDEYGVDFVIVDRTIYREANGKRTPMRPWNEDKIVFLKSDVVGALVYGALPEETANIAGVTTAKPLPYALLRKYSTLEPYTEVTDVMGLVAPIIEGGADIFVLDIAGGAVIDRTAESADSGDKKTTINGKAYDKAKLIKALNAKLGLKLPANTGDDTIIKRINELNDADEAAVLAESEVATASGSDAAHAGV